MSQAPTTAANNDADAAGPNIDGIGTVARETIDPVSTTANRAGDALRAAATSTAEMAKRVEELAADAADSNLRRVRSYIERNPLAAVGIAVGVGALVSALVRR
jgi:ElaB/YqjD/DUF883 family membrane-anchored ribosome-binding protein